MNSRYNKKKYNSRFLFSLVLQAVFTIVLLLVTAIYSNAQDFTVTDYADASVVTTIQYKGIFTAKLLYLFYNNCAYFDYPKDFQNLAITYKQNLIDAIAASNIPVLLANTNISTITKEEILIYFSRTPLNSVSIYKDKYIELVAITIFKETEFSKKLETFINKESENSFTIYEIASIPKNGTPLILLHNSLFLLGNCIENNVYEILYTLFDTKYSYTTMLPKMITMSKQERLTFLELFGYDFLYPEFEQILKHFFILYSISAIEKKLYNSTAINIKASLEAHSFCIKTSVFNAIIKLWDSFNDTAFFKFPKKYGQEALDFILNLGPEEISQYKSNPQQLLSVHNDLTAVITIDKAFGNEKSRIKAIKNILSKIGITKTLNYDTYIKNKQDYDKQKLFFITIAYKKNAQVLASYFSIEYTDVFTINSLSIPAFNAISYFVVKENPALVIVTSSPIIGYAYSQLENLNIMSLYIDVKKYSIFKKILLFLKSIIRL